MKKSLPATVVFVVLFLTGYSQNVGIGTTNPIARLHVKDSNVLFSGPLSIPENTQAAPPIQGAGSRFMWYAQRAALRAGFIEGNEWDKDSIGRYSAAIGWNSKATQIASIALGHNATASGADAVALGAFTIASNTATTAMGELSVASGYGSTAMGVLTTASGMISTAMGESTVASGLFSTSMGHSTLAQGDTSVAMGASTSATGLSSTAMGSHSTASGNSATAMGRFTNAIGYASTAMGESSTAWSHASTAIGNATTAMGWASVALGNSTIATGTSATAMGEGSRASSYAATAMGHFTVATGMASTAMGSETFASGTASTALGYGTKAKSSHSLVAGRFNDTTATDCLFSIGCGGGNLARKNAIIITSNGSVGIGKNNPATYVEISHSSSGGTYHPWTLVGIESAASHFLSLLTGNSGETGIIFGNQQSGSDGGITYRAITANMDPQALYFRAASSTRMAIYNNGNAWLQGTLSQYSDARMKKNISRLPAVLPELLQLSGYTYFWKDEGRDKAQQIGLIAQEVQKFYPQLVSENSKGELSVNYPGLIPVLLEGIKEQQQQIEELKHIINNLLNK